MTARPKTVAVAARIPADDAAWIDAQCDHVRATTGFAISRAQYLAMLVAAQRERIGASVQQAIAQARQ